MTAKFCNLLRDQLISLPFSSNEIVESSPVFQKDRNGVFNLYGGFGPKYEYPKWNYAPYQHEVGAYATLDDLRNLFTIGIEHGRQKAIGWKNRWDANFCNSIGGYPGGSIVYTDDGVRMFSRKTVSGNYAKPPSDGKTNENWVNSDARPDFSPGFDFSDIISFDEGVREKIPTTPTTTKFIAATISPGIWIGGLNNTISMFVFTYLASFRTNKGYEVAIDLCSEGHMSMKLSPFNDIYTNPKHKDEYIEVLSCTNMQVKPYKDMGITWSTQIRAPHKAIPINHKNTLYLYLEYENGCMYKYDSTSSYLTGRGGFRIYRTGRILRWPYLGGGKG